VTAVSEFKKSVRILLPVPDELVLYAAVTEDFGRGLGFEPISQNIG